MSDSWIAFQPAIEEPSNIMPSANVSSSMVLMSKVTCCHLPRGSVKRKSAYLTSLSLIIFMTFLAVVMECIPFRTGYELKSGWIGASDSVQTGFPRSNPDRFFDVRDEDFAVANTPGLGGATDRLDGFFDHIVTQHNLDLHLGQKIDDVLSAAIELGMSLLATETLGLGYRDPLQPHLLQRFLHLVEFERLDDGLDLLHRVLSPGTPGYVPEAPRSRIAGSVPRAGFGRNARHFRQLAAGCDTRPKAPERRLLTE